MSERVTHPMPMIMVEQIPEGYRLSAPDFGLSCVAPDIAAGYRQLQSLIASAGPSETQGQPENAWKSSAPPRSRGFGGVALILVAAMMVPIMLPLGGVLSDVRVLTGVIRSITVSAIESPGADIMRASSNGLVKTAELVSGLTPEREKELSDSIAIIAQKLAPLAAAACPLIAASGLGHGCPATPASQPKAQ